MSPVTFHGRDGWQREFDALLAIRLERIATAGGISGINTLIHRDEWDRLRLRAWDGRLLGFTLESRRSCAERLRKARHRRQRRLRWALCTGRSGAEAFRATA